MLGGIDVTPTLPVADMAKAVEFWESAGFDVHRYDDGFAFVSFDEQSVFDLDLVDGFDPAANCAGCYIITDQTEAWHDRFSAGMTVTSIEDMPWGMRESAVTDPNGNRIRIRRSTPDTAEA